MRPVATHLLHCLQDAWPDAGGACETDIGGEETDVDFDAGNNPQKGGGREVPCADICDLRSVSLLSDTCVAVRPQDMDGWSLEERW